MDQKEINSKFFENEKLIYFVIENFIQNKDSLNILCSKEDLYQVGAIGLVQAIKSYDESRGAFSTYAINIIRNKILNTIRDNKDIAADTYISFDDKDSFVENNPSLKYNNYKKVDDELFKEEQKEILYKIARGYTGVAKKGVIAIHLMTSGYSSRAVAAMFNTDVKNLSSWISRARSKLKNEKVLLAFLSKESEEI